MASPFRMDFNITDYEHLFPEEPKDPSLIINCEYDNINDQYWRKLKPQRDRFGEIVNFEEFLIQEKTRILNGAWAYIKGELMWLPPDFYFFLQYWNAMGKIPEFRLKALKSAYHDEEVIRDTRIIGDLKFKNRRDGETTYKTGQAFIAPIRFDVTHCQVSMQSKNSDTIKNSCWKMMKGGLNGLPKWFKDYFIPDLVSEDKIQEQIRIERIRDESNDDDMGRGITYNWGPCIANHFDGSTDIIRMLFDEFAKWDEDSIVDAFICIKKIVMPSQSLRTGLMHLFSSPSEKAGFANDNAYWLYKQSMEFNPETGTTKSRLKPYYSNPRDGIINEYDKFGDVDPDKIEKHILQERNSLPKDKVAAEIRAYPLPIKGTNQPNEEELFGAFDSGKSIFMNAAGIKKQVVFVKENQQKLNVFGNLEWPNNVPFSGIPLFRQADIMEFHDHTARWCFTFPNIPRIESLGDIRKPPTEALIQGIIGIDPFNSIYHTKNKDKQSYGAAVGWQFRDFSAFGTNEMPTGAYLSRPPHKKIFLDDMIKYCIFTGYKIQHEDLDNDSLFEYFLENEMLDWLLDSRSGKFVETPSGNFKRKGDSGSGRGAKAFTIEIMNLIDGVTNVPVNDNEPYHLLNFNIYQVLEDLLKLDLSDTQHNHLSMALGQALLGRGKLLTRRIIKPSAQMDEAMSVLFS